MRRRSSGRSGIIPARAGFTRRRPGLGGGRADHPRSRGVYGGEVRVVGRPDRIIPARAGFTPGPPRFYRAGRGSSPLARGLRRRSACARCGRRIIPARAGFTRPGRPPLGAGPDHPRSRGVYWRRPCGSPDHRGSSPLARGLRVAHRLDVVLPGIIPARAGFTTGPPRPIGAAGDHPRSRGVYRRRRPRRRPRPRIIPARAGFTDDEDSTCACLPDHPRSRGVYAVDFVVAGKGMGIIPARAGFTPHAGDDGGGGVDHPRSRGVYADAVEWSPAP